MASCEMFVNLAATNVATSGSVSYTALPSGPIT